MTYKPQISRNYYLQAKLDRLGLITGFQNCKNHSYSFTIDRAQQPRLDFGCSNYFLKGLQADVARLTRPSLRILYRLFLPTYSDKRTFYCNFYAFFFANFQCMKSRTDSKLYRSYAT